jgi:hypothetical protein
MLRKLVVTGIGAVVIAAVLLGSASAHRSQIAKACGKAPHKMAGKPTLPAKFPTPSHVVYSNSMKAGPTTIVKGYYTNGNLTAIHHAYANAFKSAGYVITHQEQDAADSEVDWAGAKTTGQVSLAKRCDSRILITLTIRPA